MAPECMHMRDRACPIGLRYAWRQRAPSLASSAHRGREQIQFPRAGVVPHEMESPGAAGDALPVADPPDAVLPAGGRRRVEGIKGALVTCSGAPKRNSPLGWMLTAGP
jgi:hypothetical protein